MESKFDLRVGAVAVALGVGLLGCSGVASADDGSTVPDSPATHSGTGATNRASSAVKTGAGRSRGTDSNSGTARITSSPDGRPAARVSGNSRSREASLGGARSIEPQLSGTGEGVDSTAVGLVTPFIRAAASATSPRVLAAAASSPSAKVATASTPVPSVAAPSPMIFVGLLNSFGLGLGPGRGAVPPWGGSALSGVLQWARREIESLLFNKTPTANPMQISQTGDGVVEGNLNAADPNGNRLAIEVTSGPSKGTVVVGNDGLYTYKADSSLAEDGGVDSFVVQVRDTGLHLNFWVPSAISVTVPVTVSANVAPVETESPTMSAPSRSSGLVSGAVHVTDANGNPLTYTVSTSPQKGTVELDDLGNFTYKPTEAARKAASARNASAGAKFDYFGITVSDGAASVDVPVTVPVAPLNDTQVDTVSVGGFPQGIAFSIDGSRAYVSNLDGTVSIVDTASRATVGSLNVGGDPTALAISPDGAKLFVAHSASGSVSIYDTASGNVVGAPIAVGERPDAILAGASGEYVYVANGNSGTVSAIATADNSVTDVGVGNAPSALAISSDGAKIYVANFIDGNITVIDTATNTVVGEPIAVGGNPSSLALSADGQTLYVTDYGHGLLSRINLADMDTYTVAVAPNLSAVVLSADNTRLYAASGAGNTVSVVDTATGKVINDISVGATPTSVALSPDGSQLYIANSNSGTVSVISIVENISNIQFGTQGFDVYNLTSHPVVYQGTYFGRGEIDGGPAVGATIQPGHTFHFEISDPFIGGNSAGTEFAYADNPNFSNWKIGMYISATNDTRTECWGAWCSDDSDGGDVYLYDPPYTQVSMTAADQTAINDLVNSACGQSWASCNFDATEQTMDYTDAKEIGRFTNSTQNTQSYTITYSNTVESSDTLEVGFRAMATIKEVVELELSTTYSHSWGTSTTFERSYNVTVSPYYKSVATAGSPIYKNDGDIIVKMGNTTFSLLDQEFISPDVNGAPDFVVHEYPL